MRTVCAKCGKEIHAAGFDEWELEELRCIECEIDAMPMMSPKEQDKFLKTLQKNRKG